MKQQFVSLVGDLSLEFQGVSLTSLFIIDKGSCSQTLLSENTGNKIINSVVQQLKAYFSSMTPFQHLPLAPAGTVFQKSVWQELIKIPLGETRTYGDIAKKLNTNARAVGNACRRNPIQIIIPCHRVISAKGIGGYAGETAGQQLDIKRWLLKHEGGLL